MPTTDNLMKFSWPDLGHTVSIVAIVLALVIFVFASLSGARSNKFRILFAVFLSTAIGWLSMPLVIKAATAVHVTDSSTGVMILITAAMLLVAALATSIYEIITVTFPDIGMAAKK